MMVPLQKPTNVMDSTMVPKWCRMLSIHSRDPSSQPFPPSLSILFAPRDSPQMRHSPVRVWPISPAVPGLVAPRFGETWRHATLWRLSGFDAQWEPASPSSGKHPLLRGNPDHCLPFSSTRGIDSPGFASISNCIPTKLGEYAWLDPLKEVTKNNMTHSGFMKRPPLAAVLLGRGGFERQVYPGPRTSFVGGGEGSS